MTPLKLASFYAAIANGGTRIEPFLIQKIEDGEGNEITFDEKQLTSCAACLESDAINDGALSQQTENQAAAPESPEDRRVISKQNAFLTTSIMKQVILSGTAKRALALERNDLAGKTGTTNDYKDAWFSGFSPDVMTSVYIGFDEPSHLGRRESGASAALPVWVDYMAGVLPDFPEKPQKVPSNIVTRFINKDNEKVTHPSDPDGYHEYYQNGTEPNNPVETVQAGTNTAPKETVTESLF